MAYHRALVNAVQRHHSHMEFHFCRFACKCIFQHIRPNLLLGNVTQVNKMLYMCKDQNTRCTARTWRAHFVISSSIHDILKNQIQFTPKKHFQIHNYPFTSSFPIFNIDIAMIINNRCCEVGFIDWRSYCRYWAQMWWIVNILDVCISLSKTHWIGLNTHMIIFSSFESIVK